MEEGRRQRFLALFVWFYGQPIRTKYSASQESLWGKKQFVLYIRKRFFCSGKSSVRTTS